MPTPETLTDLIAAIDAAQSAAGREYILPCTGKKGGYSCLHQHEGLDSQGRPKLFFSYGCKVVATFCDACLTYWLLAVARNCAMQVARVETFKKARGEP